MNFKPDQFPKKEENPSIIDRLVLEQGDLEQLPSVEEMLNDIEQAIISGKSEASELIQQAGLVEKIKVAKERVLFLNKSDVLTFLNVVKYQTDSEHPEYSQIEKAIKHFTKILGEHNIAKKRTRILIESSDIKEKNNFTRAQVLSTLSHEILHDIAKNIEVTWLNEAITERLTQGLIGDIISNSKEWGKVFAELNEKENDEIRFGSYEEERSELVVLSENIRDKCPIYANLPNNGYRELSKSESLVFKENFGEVYLGGNSSVLEKNLRELGYSSISELETLDPSV